MNVTRRVFLATGGIAAAGVVIVGNAQDTTAAENAFEIIDCHTHLYGEDDTTYPPIEKPYRPPAGKGTIAHLRQEMKAAGVRSAVDVQPMTFYGWDNRFTSDLCRDNRDVLTGVCFLDPDDPQSPAVLERYVKEFNVRGLRIIPNRKTGLLDEPGNHSLLATCQRLGITTIALVSRDVRPQLETLADRYPKLPLVIDHCMSLAVGKQYDAILEDVLTLAKRPNLNAKLSYMVTGSGQAFPFTDMLDSCRQIIKAYGAERCVWGSDFPCELWCPKATYAQHLSLITHELGLDEKTKRQILCDTPRRLGFGT